MATVSEIIFNIKNLKEGGLHSDDTDLSDDQIIFIVNYYRSRLIRQEYQKNKAILDGIEQTLESVALSTPNLANFPTLTKDFKITVEIPKPISLPNGLAFRTVGKGESTYDYIRPNRLPLIKYARYTSGESYFYPLGTRLVTLTKDINIKNIPITGIFENPIKVIEFNNNGTELEDYDVEYPLPENLLDSIYKLMIESEYAFSVAVPDRNENDTKDDQKLI